MMSFKGTHTIVITANETFSGVVYGGKWNALFELHWSTNIGKLSTSEMKCANSYEY